MIDVFSWATPNGHKVHIMLEESGLEYRLHPINIRRGDQFKPAFLEISPNNRIPAIVDQDGAEKKPISIFESGAILIYLAEKTGKFLSAQAHKRYSTIQWLMWQMGGVGPMFGQSNHFLRYATEKIPYAIERYVNEANRLTRVLDLSLSRTQYLGGDEYSIADMAVFPWMRNPERRGIRWAEYPNVNRWFNEIAERPAVQRGVKVLAHERSDAPLDDLARENYFGEKQFGRTSKS